MDDPEVKSGSSILVLRLSYLNMQLIQLKDIMDNMA